MYLSIGRLIVLSLSFWLASAALGQQKNSEAPAAGNAVHTGPEKILSITNFKLHYDGNFPGAPDLSELDNVIVELGYQNQVFYEKGNGRPVYTGTFKSLSSEIPRKFEKWAIRAITDTLTQFYLKKGFVSVTIKPGVVDKNNHLKDTNPEGTDLTLEIYMGVVTQVRSVASGDRFNITDPKFQRMNRDEHQFIRDHSPVTTQPGKSLLNKADIDDYVLSLNRHPGRHVDVAISQADSPVSSEVVLDYLVAENKPWNVTFQDSNTGTRQTNLWRERLAYTNNQLTSHDDILTIDGVMAGFDFDHSKSQSISASYEAPFFRTPLTKREVRWRVFGSYDTFTASDLGTNNGKANFIGEETGGGGELIGNLWQQRDKFIDAFGGAQYNHIRTNLNPKGAYASGSAEVIEPYIGLRAGSSTDTYDLGGTLTGRFGHSFDPHSPQPPPVPANPVNSINSLGRSAANIDWPLIQADVSYSFFLEPLLFPDQFTDINVKQGMPANKAIHSTLANELQFSLRGQTSLDRRLIPQEEEAAGGLFSVRGYPESIVAGDDVMIFSSEYRLHIPRLFNVQPDPSKTPLFGHPFRYSPQEVYGRPDWDLTLRTFFDAAFTHSYRGTSIVPETTDHGLFGVGTGLDLTFDPPHLPYIDLRCDWGIAMHAIHDGEEPVKQYSNRFTFLFTVLY